MNDKSKKPQSVLVDELRVIDVDSVNNDSASNNPRIAKSKAADIANLETVKNSATTEINGPKGLEPTRYGDWESKGRCHDF